MNPPITPQAGGTDTPDRVLKKMGGPRKEINPQQLYELAVIQCTEPEIQAVLGISAETFERRRKESKRRLPVFLSKDTEAVYLPFRDILAAGRAVGRMSLRREQWKLAQAGNATMLIWLGKQLLGQRDMIGVAGPDGGAIQVQPVYDELLSRLARIASRIGTPGSNPQIETAGSRSAPLQLEVLGASETTPASGDLAPLAGPNGAGMGKDPDRR